MKLSLIRKDINENAERWSNYSKWHRLKTGHGENEITDRTAGRPRSEPPADNGGVQSQLVPADEENGITGLSRPGPPGFS